MSGWWLISYLVLWGLTALALIILLIVLRQLGLIYLRMRGGAIRLDEGPEIGTAIAPLSSVDALTGEAVVFPPGVSRINLLLLVSNHCSICEETVRDVPSIARLKGMPVLVVGDGELVAGRDRIGELIEPPVQYVRDGERQQALGIASIPHAIVVDEKGVVLDKGIVNRFDHLEELLDRTSARLRLAERTRKLQPAMTNGGRR